MSKHFVQAGISAQKNLVGMEIKYVQIDLTTWSFKLRLKFCWDILTKKIAGIRTEDVTIQEVKE